MKYGTSLKPAGFKIHRNGLLSVELRTNYEVCPINPWTKDHSTTLISHSHPKFGRGNSSFPFPPSRPVLSSRNRDGYRAVLGGIRNMKPVEIHTGETVVLIEGGH